MKNSTSQFVSELAHELRNPLSSINMAVDIILTGTTGEVLEEQADILQKAKGHLERLKNIIEDAVYLTKLESGELPKAEIFVNINELIQESVEQFLSSLAPCGKKISFLGDATVPQTLLDQAQIRKALQAVIAQALSLSAGEVNIQTNFHPKEKEIVVTISDGGAEMNPQKIEKLFDLFSKTANPVDGTFTTGLKLPICRQILERHDGRVEAEPAENGGCLFTLTIPVKALSKVV